MVVQSANVDRDLPARRSMVWAGVVFGLLFPTIVTWAYFVLAADAGQVTQRVTGGIMKGIQFLFPAVWVWLVLREPFRWPGLRRTGIGAGVAFGLAVTLSGALVFHWVLRDSATFQAAAELILAKVAGFGLDSASQFIALGAFYALVHSLLEEYYWRWFVFGQLRRLVPLWTAIVISALGFAAHHVLVLATFFGWTSWLTLLLSAAVAIGGGYWAWLYQRSGSLVGPWLSHLVIDAGIFYVGYQLLHNVWSG